MTLPAILVTEGGRWTLSVARRSSAPLAVDVRDPEELTDPLDHIETAEICLWPNVPKTWIVLCKTASHQPWFVAREDEVPL